MTSPTPRERRLAECLQRILQAPDFPAFSRQMQEIMTSLADEETSIQRLANLVLSDYSLTLKVLRTANSSHYNRSGRPIRSATQAMMLVGARAVRDLASSLLLFEHYHKRSPGLRELLLLSMLSASHAREAAIHAGLAEPEVAHLCGMFRNLGEVLIACHFPEEYAQILRVTHERSVSQRAAAMEVLQFPYEELGVAIARHWGMPDTVQAGIRATGAIGETLPSLVTAFGHDLTAAIYRSVESRTEAALTELQHHYATRLHLSRDDLRTIIDTAVKETRTLFVDAQVELDDLRLARQTKAALRELSDTPSTTHGATAGAAAEHALGQLRQQLLAELAVAVPRTGEELHQLMLMVLEAAFRGAPADRAVFCLFDAERTELRARFGLGTNVDEFIKSFRIPMPPAGGTIGSALLKGHDVILGGERPSTLEEARWLQSHGARGAAFFVISLEGKPIGAMYYDRASAPMLLDAETGQYLQRLRELAVRAVMAGRGGSTPEPDAPREWSAAEKSAAVLRLLRGDTADVVAAEIGVSTAELEIWRADFLAGAVARLADTDRAASG